MSWADLNFLWLVPVGAGPIFVMAVLLYAAWRSHVRGRDDGDFEPRYAASKPARRERGLSS